MTKVREIECEIMRRFYADFDELLKGIPKPVDPRSVADDVVRKDIEAEQVNLRG